MIQQIGRSNGSTQPSSSQQQNSSKTDKIVKEICQWIDNFKLKEKERWAKLLSTENAVNEIRCVFGQDYQRIKLIEDDIANNKSELLAFSIK
jgi:hypothetical protein